MAETTGYKGKGVTLGYAVGTATSYTTIAQIRDVRGPNIDVTDINISNADSPGDWMEYLPGMKDGGEITFDVVYKPATGTTIHGLVAQTGNTWQVTLPDNGTATGSTIRCGGYLKSLGNDVPYNDAITNSATIKVSGGVTFTAHA